MAGRRPGSRTAAERPPALGSARCGEERTESAPPSQPSQPASEDVSSYIALTGHGPIVDFFLADHRVGLFEKLRPDRSGRRNAVPTNVFLPAETTWRNFGTHLYHYLV